MSRRADEPCSLTGGAAAPRLDLSSAERLLVFGGPYSNIEATRALIARAGELGIPPDHVICTGDVVAYGADPNATCAALRDWGCHVIAGNCELNLEARAGDCGCGFGDGTACDRLAQGWYAYADRVLDEDHRRWMARLPARLDVGFAGRRLHVLHGGHDDVSRFIFASTCSTELAATTVATGADIVLAGHCGLPFINTAPAAGRRGRRAWFNAGVIGMPANDGTRDGWYGLLTNLADRGRLQLSLHRLAYDHASAAAALNRSGHAPAYADALLTGLWPSLDVLPPAERAATGRRLPGRIVVIGSGAPAAS